VRLIVWLVLILMALGWLASELPLTATQNQSSVEAGWRRTRDGWEIPTWNVNGGFRRVSLHPAVVGLFEISLALAVLIAFRRDCSAVRPRCPQSATTHLPRSSCSGPYRFMTASKPAEVRHVFTRRPPR